MPENMSDGWRLADAAAAGNASEVKRLLSLGYGANFENPARGWPLTAAAKACCPAAVEALLAAGAMVAAVQNGGQTAFHVAAMSGDPENRLLCVKLLLAAKAPANAEDKSGATPLFGAADAAVAEAIIGAGGAARHVSKSGETALHFAADAAVADVLIRHGADCNARTKPKHGEQTPLHRAAVAPVAEAIIKGGGDCNAEDSDGISPFEALIGIPGMAAVMLAHGGNALKATKDGRTMLHRAAESSADAETVRLLAEAGCQTEARMLNGDTPIMRCRNAETAQALIGIGCDAAALNNRNRTALMVLARDADVEGIPMARILLANGCDLLARDTTGKSAIDFAECNRAMQAFLMEARQR